MNIKNKIYRILKVKYIKKMTMDLMKIKKKD